MHTTQLTDEWGGTYAKMQLKNFKIKKFTATKRWMFGEWNKPDCKNFARIDTVSYNGKSCLSVNMEQNR
jgi:hypothetical protein